MMTRMFFFISLITIAVAQESDSNDNFELPVRFGNEYSAQGKGFDCVENVCDSAADYPEEHINNVMKGVGDLHNFLGYSEGSFVPQGSRVAPDDSFVEEKTPLCQSIKHIKFPKTLQNQMNATKYIINIGDYKQGVIFETCVKKAHCGDASFPIPMKAECIQKYSTSRLLSIATKGGSAEFDSFVIPSSCVCVISKLRPIS